MLQDLELWKLLAFEKEKANEGRLGRDGLEELVETFEEF